MRIGFLSGLILLIFLISNANGAWYNNSYSSRFPIISNSTGFYPVSVNDTRGFNNTIIWSLIMNNSYLYYNLSLPILIANETQNYHENETDRTGFNPKSVWDNNYIAVYHFGENTSTKFNDSTANNLNGTLVNSPTWSDGKFGSNVKFTGSNDYGYVTDNDLFTQNYFTLEAWFKPTLINSAHHDIVGKINSGSPTEYIMRIDNANKLDCGLWTDYSSGNAVSTSVLVANNWYYGACVWNSTHLKVYLNGTLEATTSISGTVTNGASNFVIGWEASLNFFHYQGWIDEVRFSKIARTDNYFKTNYYNGINNLTILGPLEEIPVIINTHLNLTANGLEADQNASCSISSNIFSIKASNLLNVTGQSLYRNGILLSGLTDVQNTIGYWNYTTVLTNENYTANPKTIFLNVTQTTLTIAQRSKFCDGKYLVSNYTTINNNCLASSTEQTYTYCEYDCISEFNVCSPSPFGKLIVFIVIVFIILMGLTWIKEKWLR